VIPLLLAMLATELAILCLAVVTHLRLRRVLGYLGVEAKMMAQDAEFKRQQRSSDHQVTPPRLVKGTWVGDCSCGWTTVGCGSGEEALDLIENHKRAMRRAA
jgi:hypothetical protein